MTNLANAAMNCACASATLWAQKTGAVRSLSLHHALLRQRSSPSRRLLSSSSPIKVAAAATTTSNNNNKMDDNLLSKKKIQLSPQAPFGLEKKAIYKLQKDLEASHEEFWSEMMHDLLTATDAVTVDHRNTLRQQWVKNLRQELMKHEGILATAKKMWEGKVLYERTEQGEGMKEATNQLILAEQMLVAQALAKKCLYEFPPIYSHVLQEIFNEKLLHSPPRVVDDDGKEKVRYNHLLSSRAISPQLNHVLRDQFNALAKAGIETKVRVRQEASPPTVIGFATRAHFMQFGNGGSLPKKLSLLHVPGGAVPMRHFPSMHSDSSLFPCVHILVHTHETYSFSTTSTRRDGKSSSVKTNMPRILTLVGRFEVDARALIKPLTKETRETLRKEAALAIMEDSELNLFHPIDRSEYQKRYPHGSSVNATIGIQWQLVDIDFLVARTQGWVETDHAMGNVGQVRQDRFCYQPPEGHYEFHEEDAEEDGHLRRPLVVFLVAAAELSQVILLLVLVPLFLLPSEFQREWSKALGLEEFRNKLLIEMMKIVGPSPSGTGDTTKGSESNGERTG